MKRRIPFLRGKIIKTLVSVILLIVSAGLLSCDSLIYDAIENQENEYKISRILFMSNRDGNNEIYSMNPDGTAPDFPARQHGIKPKLVS